MIRSTKPKPAVERPAGALAILELVEDESLSRAKVDDFIAKHSFPIVEGSNCTFLFRGEAEQVHLRHWIFGLPSSQPFQHLAGTDLWYLVMEIPACSRVEYKLEVVHRGHGRWIEDPLNPHRARDPFGANSVIYGAGYVEPEWAQVDPEARPGTFEDETFASKAFGDERRITVYLPARFRPTRQYPLLLVHDGGDYLQFSGLKTVLDNLIYRLEIPELVAVLTYPEERLREYADDERHARFLTEELIPKMEAKYPLRGTPASRCLMGASFGAVASLSTAIRYPNAYGRLLLQSGSFAFTDIGTSHQRGPLFDPVVEMMNNYRAFPKKVAERVFVSCGIYESLIYENRSIVPVLQGTGMEVRFVEARDGHNWENWRDRLREGLSWLFPGPLWMVYE